MGYVKGIYKFGSSWGPFTYSQPPSTELKAESSKLEGNIENRGLLFGFFEIVIGIGIEIDAF